MISIPRGATVTVSEDSGAYEPSYEISGGTSDDSNATGNIVIDADKTVAFTNDLKVASPTGVTTHAAPSAFMLAFGLLLLLTLRIVKRRKGEN